MFNTCMHIYLRRFPKECGSDAWSIAQQSKGTSFADYMNYITVFLVFLALCLKGKAIKSKVHFSPKKSTYGYFMSVVYIGANL